MNVAGVGVHVSRCLKEGLAWATDKQAWATDKQLWVIRHMMKHVILQGTKE